MWRLSSSSSIHVIRSKIARRIILVVLRVTVRSIYCYCYFRHSVLWIPFVHVDFCDPHRSLCLCRQHNTIALHIIIASDASDLRRMRMRSYMASPSRMRPLLYLSLGCSCASGFWCSMIVQSSKIAVQWWLYPLLGWPPFAHLYFIFSPDKIIYPSPRWSLLNLTVPYEDCISWGWCISWWLFVLPLLLCLRGVRTTCLLGTGAPTTMSPDLISHPLIMV